MKRLKALDRGLATLMEYARPSFPVRVRLRRMATAWGHCRLVGKGRKRHFLVTLDADAPLTILSETLIHEYAHALSWESGWGHGRAWGAAYARCYRIAVEEKAA